MSLKLNIKGCVSGECDVLTITEITGLYNANSNTTGWDLGETVNINKSGITSATLQIKGPDQTAYTSITVTTTVSSSSAYVEEFTLAVLSPSDIGMSTFENGQYEFIYTVVDSGNEYVKKVSKVFLCVSHCCKANLLKELLLNFDSECDCCNDRERITDLMIASLLIEGAENVNCLTSIQLNRIIQILNKICNEDNCCG